MGVRSRASERETPMRTVFAFLVFVSIVWSPPAHAQLLGAPGMALNDAGVIQYRSRDWVLCASEEQVQPQRAISACGRIIGERFSREASASAHYYRSVLYRQAGEVERANADVARAIQLLSELVQSEPDNPVLMSNLIFLRTETRDFAGAAEDYGRLAMRRPQSAEPRVRQGEFLFRGGDYAGAISAFDAAAQLEPGNPQTHAGRCEARAAANLELDVAEQACVEAIRLSGQSSSALFSRGFLYFKQGRLEEALSDFESAGRLDNTNAFAAYGFAVANLRLGRYEEQARALLADVSRAVPDVETYAQAGMRP